MKKSIHNLKALIPAMIAGRGGRLSVLLALCWMTTQVAVAQTPDCNTIMACNDGVQVSLDENCEAIITPDVMLENMIYPNSFYTVELRDQAGVPLGTTTVDASHIGATIEVRVSLNGCSLSCWGNITIEDKLSPLFTSCPTATVDCEDPTSPGSPGVPRSIAVDACGPVTYQHFDESMLMACSTPYSEIINRTWVATDLSGNTDTCVQVIQIRQASLADVTFPRDYDDFDLPAFSCDNNIQFDPDGTPSPNSTGFPSGIECSNIQWYYTDITFDLCGVSQKFVRQWVVIDWCTGQERSDFQTIKIIDDAPPLCSAVDDIFVGITTDEGVCTGTFDVPAPNVQFECSEWDYIVGYKLRDVNGDPFENPIYDNVVTNPDGTFTITDLPMDTTWIVYTVTDACGNQTMCFTEVFVEDEEAPSPVCEGFTTISLDEIGWADLFATSVDDHSHDNCAIDRFEVRRLNTTCGEPTDLEFGEKVNFCCSDIPNNPIQVVLRVYDVSGNHNECIVSVTVQDKISPEIDLCLPDVELSCGQDPFDMSLTGGMDLLQASDNCDLTITSTTSGSIGDCGTGTILRRWRVEDTQGRSDVCTQTITVVDTDVFGTDDIKWPGNMQVTECDITALTPEDLNSFPILSNTDCSNIAMSFTNEEFYNTPDVCVKLLRNWVIVDWCDGTGQNPVRYEYTQKIEIRNTTKPVFVSGCTNGSFNPEVGLCEAQVEVEVLAEDDCTSAADMRYTYTIDADSNNSIDFTGTGSSFDRVLPAGRHLVSFTAIDKCDNDQSCSFTVTVSDNKAPQPICLGELVWVMGDDGTTEVWASDFNLKSTDDCSDDALLTYSFNEQGTMPAMTFTCDDIPNGIGEAIDLEMYVLDPEGNVSFCSVTLNLQDNQGYCDDIGTRAAIGGSIAAQDGEGIENIEVELVNLTDVQEVMDMTTEEGDYMFDAIDYYDQYRVAPTKNDDTGNGVSTLDLVLIQRHILGLSTFEEPTLFVAADINNSKSITGSDVVELRKVILGKQTEFGSNTSWRFVDSRHDWDEVDFPYDFPEEINLDDLYIDQMNADFTGIKVGDVNGSAKASDLDGRSAGMYLVISDAAVVAGEEITVDFMVDASRDLLGMQLAVDVQGLRFSHAQGVRPDQIAVEGSTIAFAIDAATGLELSSGETVMSITLTATQDGQLSDMIDLNQEKMASEAYDKDASVMGLDLKIRGNAVHTAGTLLAQNVPNPWDQVTSITYTIPVDSDVTLSFYDVSGRLLHTVNRYDVAGEQTIVVDRDDIRSTGVIYYQLDAAGTTITKKMILMD